MTVSFEERRQAWASPPVDDVGYISSLDLLALSDEALRHTIDKAERNRYGGWRNHQGNWRRVLGLDSTRDAAVLDYGCGIGVEALQYARAGNHVTVADIAPSNVDLAERVLRLYGITDYDGQQIKNQPPFLIIASGTLDVIHCSGVLHHIPQPKPVVKQMARWLKPGGELRLMLYSDEAWRIATRTEPPNSVKTNQYHEKYWQTWDGVGGYADWYDCDRLTERFGQWFDVKHCEYLTEHREYLGAVLVKR